jgi:hypothetical protein
VHLKSAGGVMNGEVERKKIVMRDDLSLGR